MNVDLPEPSAPSRSSSKSTSGRLFGVGVGEFSRDRSGLQQQRLRRDMVVADEDDVSRDEERRRMSHYLVTCCWL